MFLFANKFETSNYADDIYAAIKNISQILNDLSNDSGSVYGFLEQNFELHYENTVIKKSGEEKMLGITIDNKLKLKSHIKNIWTVANQKLNALCRISNCIDSDKCKLLVNVLFKSQCSCCPLIWMFCMRESSHRLNWVHEMTLIIISEDYNSSFSDLVAMLNEKTIHQMCIDFLMTKALKCLNGLSQNLINVSF